MHSSAATDQWISFKVGSETYAQPIAAVKEVIPYTPPVPVPGAPQSVDGILNVRGEVITVLCGLSLFVSGQREAADDGRIIILDTGRGHIGVSVDAVGEIVTLEDGVIETNEHSMSHELIVGTARHGDQLLILVDLEGYYEKATARTDAPA